MLPVAEVFERHLRQAVFHDPKVPVVTNVGAKLVRRKDELEQLLGRQIYSRVEWEASMRRLLALGVERFIEVGPGRVLAGLMKKIDNKAVCHYVEDAQSLEKLLGRTGEVVESAWEALSSGSRSSRAARRGSGAPSRWRWPRAGRTSPSCDLNPDGVASAVAELAATGRRAFGFTGDVSSLAFAQEAVAKTDRRGGRRCTCS